MVFIGIDPGLDGALAILHEDRRVEFYDTPTVRIGKKRRYDFPGMKMIIVRLDNLDVCAQSMLAGLELVHAMPKQGVTSSFNFGRGFGAWEALLISSEIPYELVPPKVWKRATIHGLPKGQEKDVSRVMACQLFPHCQADLCLKRHHNRADALLIAEYLKRKRGSHE